MLTRTALQRKAFTKPTSVHQPSLHTVRPFSPPATRENVGTAAGRAGHDFGKIDAAPRPPAGRPGIPRHLKARLEKFSGMDLSDVRVHYNSPEPARLQAFAHTRGDDIHLGPGQERHLPHEAWHVVQQRQGRVRSTTQMKGLPVNDNGSLEREADVMGARAAGARSFASASPAAAMPRRAAMQRRAASAPPASNAGGVCQRQPWKRFKNLPWKHMMKWGGGLYGSFVARNVYNQYNIKKNPDQYPNEKGRLKAAEITSKAKPGQAGYAMSPLVSLFHGLFGNIGSSNIGEHYQKDIPHMISGPDTDENLEGIGSHETSEFWNKQKGVAYLMGRGLDAKRRANWLKKSRDMRKMWDRRKKFGTK